MKRAICLFLVIGVACALLFWKLTQRHVASPDQIENPASQSLSEAPHNGDRVRERTAQDIEPTSTNGSASSAGASAAAPGGADTVSTQMLTSWQAPIEFYGKVVDESNNPVAAARIGFHWVEAPKPDGNRSLSAESDANGLFSLQGAHGPSLTVSVGKDGYYTARQGVPEFRYGLFKDGAFSPDPLNPVIFHLRKKGVTEPLISLKRNYPIARDGTPMAINLDTGAVTPGENGNAVVQCWTQDQGKTSGQRYNWRCRVTIPGGGIVPTDEEFPFLAPEEGYKQSSEINMPADRTDWTSDVELKFFFRLADGRYGRMTFSIIAGGQHFCMIDSSLNPTGSRNLEPAN